MWHSSGQWVRIDEHFALIPVAMSINGSIPRPKDALPVAGHKWRKAVQCLKQLAEMVQIQLPNMNTYVPHCLFTCDGYLLRHTRKIAKSLAAVMLDAATRSTSTPVVLVPHTQPSSAHTAHPGSVHSDIDWPPLPDVPRHVVSLCGKYVICTHIGQQISRRKLIRLLFGNMIVLLIVFGHNRRLRTRICVDCAAATACQCTTCGPYLLGQRPPRALLQNK